jgi:hypothetical protein
MRGARGSLIGRPLPVPNSIDPTAAKGWAPRPTGYYHRPPVASPSTAAPSAPPASLQTRGWAPPRAAHGAAATLANSARWNAGLDVLLWVLLLLSQPLPLVFFTVKTPQPIGLHAWIGAPPPA